jgi:hypothetical protein
MIHEQHGRGRDDQPRAKHGRFPTPFYFVFQNDLRKSLASILAFHHLKIPQRQGPAGCRAFRWQRQAKAPPVRITGRVSRFKLVE